METDKLAYLAEFIRIRNVADQSIARLIGRPAHSGHIAEFIASRIFDIELHPRAVHKSSDGCFRSGPFKDQTVNVKFASRNTGVLDLVGSNDPAHHPDVYLVMTGPRSSVVSSVDTVAPWVVTEVYIFRSIPLLEYLTTRGVNIGVATSVRKPLWEEAMVYPSRNLSLYPLSSQQRSALELFMPVFEGD